MRERRMNAPGGGHSLAVFAATLLLALLLPQRAAATYVDETYNYQVMLNGSNTIRIQVPVYDQENEDTYIDDGKLTAQWTDNNGQSHSLYAFLWKRTGGSIDSGNSDVSINFKTEAGGSFKVTQGNSSNNFTLTSEDDWQSRTIYRNSDGHSYNVSVVWRVPYDMLGCEVKFSWDVHRTGTGTRKAEKVSGLNSSTITIPEAQSVVVPQVTMATLAYSEAGKLELPWFIASNDITAARYEYTDYNGQPVSVALPTDANNGTIYLDATVPHDNFRVVVSYKDNDGYELKDISSSTQDLMMIHAPMGLIAQPLGDHKSSVQLTWNIMYPNTSDMTSTDFFEVQRSLTGEEADFVTIGSEPFVLNSDKLSYTYVDSTLIDAIADGQLTGNGTLDRLTYRVRRMITQNWGWDGNNCAQQSSCTVSDIHLLRISDYSARWEDERAYSVRVAWDYADEPNAVWDNRAKMMLRITSTNSAGEVVETQEMELSAAEREQRYKIVNLTRPCVDFKIEVYVNRGTSPIHLWEELTPYYFPIRTSADWDTFRQKVLDAKGQYDVNARLYADISTVNSCGSDSAPFMGHFDGNGHTINVNINSSNSQALFLQVNGATITNLKLTGTITGSRGCGGLIGGVAGGDNRIESCHSSVTVSSTADGDGSNGGFVGVVGGGTLTMTNCAFYGTMAGANCTNNGGFIGWVRSVNGVMVTLTNCLFAPEAITTKLDGCRTFARTGSDARLQLINCQSNFNYYYEPLPTTVTVSGTEFFIIRNATDWQTFVSKVNSAQGNSDVNAILYDDITVTSPVGTGNARFRGIFDGNGHTLNLNITANEDYTAPFQYAGNATFRNLVVAGSVSGALYTSGLVGFGYDAYTLDINNVRVSATVTSTGTHVGGLVGHAHKGSVNITDCLFDGKLVANGTAGSYGGAFCGWGEGTWIYDRLYENGSGEGISHFGYCYQGGSALGGGPTCYSAHNWGEMSSDANRNVTDQSKAVELLGSQWQLAGGKAVPITSNNGDDPETEVEVKTADELLATLGSGWRKEGNAVVPVTTQFAAPSESYPTPTLPTFHHESIGKVEKTLLTQTRQSSVVITWDTDGNPVDYFQVLRREKGSSDWDVIADQLDRMSYEDTTVSPLMDYEYLVRGANDCEGMSYSETDIAQGACKHTGRVSGYVRMKDGTGIPGIDVSVTAPSGETTTVKTDEAGYFVADELSYFGQPSITYTVTPVNSSAIKLEVESYAVTFNNESNGETLHEFIITNGHRFTGYVMYDGTSIPVKGARFRVNGQPLHNNKGGYVETDFDGAFSFYVLDGKNTIQAVMDGHTFTNDGYFKGTEGHEFTDDVAQIYFYDDTKVKLVGRIAGGDDQGRLPLDNNLSSNNLGDDLTMVFTLEGDNTSWLVYDNLNPGRTQRDTTFVHIGGNHRTQVQTMRKRMIVKPDSVTGEYVLMLPPVRWKVQQIYCKGYPTLFQDGMASEVVDLTDCLTLQEHSVEGSYNDVDGNVVYQPVERYNATYSRIYHSPVEITYRQINYDSFDYFGDKTYTAQTVGGDKMTVPLAFEEDASNTAAYTFGHPVFSLDRTYPIEIQVAERYPYNNEANSQRTDLVKIGGGQVAVHNGMKVGTNVETVSLDEQGQGKYYLQADATTRLLTGEDALRTVTMTLTQDGTTYEAEPLRGYILNMFATSSAKDVLVKGEPVLIDILRDPPGGGSSATLSKGSTLKYTYTLDMKLKAGLHLNIVTGSKLDNYQGSVAAPSGAGWTTGIINSNDNEELLDFEYAFDMEGHRAFAYTMNVTQDITTSSDPKMVGADADLYIGTVQNIVVTPMSTIRAIPDSLYQHMLGRLGGTTDGINNQYGSLVHIAEGHDAQGNKYHLVRDESIGYGPEVQSQFVHSQKHILTQLIPEKVKELRALMFTGTKEEAQTQADATGKPVYWSKVSADDELFGAEYEMVKPTGTTTDFTDEAFEIFSIIDAWIQMVADNEHEKIVTFSTTNNLLANYDVDGGSKVNYNEQFESEYSISNYYHLPGIMSGQYFDEDGSDMGIVIGSIVGIKVVQFILKEVYKKNVNSTTGANGGSAAQGKDNANGFNTAVNFYGSTFKFSLLPVLDYEVKNVAGESKSFSRKESFNIVMDKKSHLNFNVYRVDTDVDVLKSAGQFDVFTNANFNDMTDYVENHLKIESSMDDARYARGFVYQTLGGATVNPWEDARRTLVYSPGHILDERTKKICNPKITADRQSISGVPYGEPARFTLNLTNDSEMPEAATGGVAVYVLYLKENTNPGGARIFVDGQAIDGGGRDIILEPGQMVQKVVEVYAGEDFDYEGITIGLAAKNDWEVVYDEVKLDVHYLHEAGPVSITMPGTGWVINTESQYDEKQGWFMPVTISGFNKHQHNFDHIEFQYKDSRRGDDAWTNLCSYYADSLLLAQASGQREMIPENGNIQTRFFGEGPVVERGYDLRAVLYCRNGNSFLTTASEILSGVKDTRRPQLFGSQEPTGGILALGANIIFNFSEDIEHNYLDAKTNFEVRGEVNNNNVSDAVSVQFTGTSSVESEAQRNFSGKDLTIDLMIRPDQTGRDMPLFSHGSNGKKLQLWLTADKKLKAVVDDQTYTSEGTIESTGFTQVAMVIDNENSKLRFFNGGTQIGEADLAKAYNGTGRLIFGRTQENDRKKATYYEGRMMEARLWYRAMTGGLIGTTYGSQRLTGYEMGLVDYYPMNEGTGSYALDKTQGANAQLIDASWAVPRGMSLHVDWEDKGLELTQQALNRTKEQDYTLTFWFKTDTEGRGVLVSNGAGMKTDIGAENQFNIAFEAEKLMFRSNGMAIEVPGDWSDNQWHHYAMTVNRAHSLANIYVDETLRTTFATDSLGGISGGHPLIGGAKYDTTDENGVVATIDTRNWLRGNIDELCLFAQALPLQLIKAYATKSPQGDEAGLLTYLPFDRQERQKDNSIETVAYPYSKKVYTDEQGNQSYELDPVTQQPTTTPVRDYVFVDDVDEILSHITDETAAPVVPYEELHNLNFGFVGKDNQVFVNIDEQASRINRRNIYVTLRDIEDRNGNTIASPQTACYYVTNSALQWSTSRISETMHYGWDNNNIYLAVVNFSSTTHTYTIENCPKWLTLDKYTDRISPQDYTAINATVNKDLNVGSYDEVIYLVDEDGVSEPLYLSITVEGDEPEWSYDIPGELLKYSMNIAGQVYINNELDIETRDIVGVFDRNNNCHGVANISYSALTGEAGLYITVHDSLANGRELYFKMWQYATGRELVLTPNQTITFQNKAVYGLDSPVRFDAGERYVQTFDLKEGWNWVSFNVASEELFNLNNLLDGLPWKENDILTDMSSDLTLIYKDGHWIGSGKTGTVRLSPRKSYAIMVQEDIDFPVAGNIISQPDARTIELKQGWNGIGYTPMMNLSVETALSDYYDKAEVGDVIKSHDQFAYFTKVGGVGRWKGSLQYMKPGEGYMLLHNGEGDVAFMYPFYEPGSTFLDEWSYSTSRAEAPARSKSTMSVSAVVQNFETEDGDRLVAYSNGERVGETIVSSESPNTEPLYLSIGGAEQSGIWFTIERDGEIVASTPEVMTYTANAVVGSPDEPTAINFARSENEEGVWYTIGGLRLQKRPTQSGVYIYNGKKIIIK